MNRTEKAVGMFADSYNCAQAVLTAFSADTGMSEDDSCRIACAFGAGGGRRQLCCGAVSGALMVISQLRGRGKGGTKADQEEAYALTRDFFAEFESRHGTSECRILLDGVNLLTEAGQNRYREEDMKPRCETYIRDSVMLLERILAV